MTHTFASGSKTRASWALVRNPLINSFVQRFVDRLCITLHRVSNIQETRFDDLNTVHHRAATAIKKRGFERDVIWSRWVWVAFRPNRDVVARKSGVSIKKFRLRKQSCLRLEIAVQEKRPDHA